MGTKTLRERGWKDKETARARARGGWGLTLVQRRRHAALHPRRVVVHDVDGDVGVPVGDHLHGPIVLSPLRGDGVRQGWERGASETPACFLLRAPVTFETAEQ